MAPLSPTNGGTTFNLTLHSNDVRLNLTLVQFLFAQLRVYMLMVQALVALRFLEVGHLQEIVKLPAQTPYMRSSGIILLI
jgi:hypothetical protein